MSGRGTAAPCAAWQAATRSAATRTRKALSGRSHRARERAAWSRPACRAKTTPMTASGTSVASIGTRMFRPVPTLNAVSRVASQATPRPARTRSSAASRARCRNPSASTAAASTVSRLWTGTGGGHRPRTGGVRAPITKYVMATDVVRAAAREAAELTVTVVPIARGAGDPPPPARPGVDRLQVSTARPRRRGRCRANRAAGLGGGASSPRRVASTAARLPRPLLRHRRTMTAAPRPHQRDGARSPSTGWVKEAKIEAAGDEVLPSLQSGLVPDFTPARVVGAAAAVEQAAERLRCLGASAPTMCSSL
jgi:hypothetical protein